MCVKCRGNAPIPLDQDTEPEDDFEWLIQEIGELVSAHKAGFPIGAVDYIRGSLFTEWIAAEKEVLRIQNARHQMWLKAQFNNK